MADIPSLRRKGNYRLAQREVSPRTIWFLASRAGDSIESMGLGKSGLRHTARLSEPAAQAGSGGKLATAKLKVGWCY
jgi:hypothetical protein